MYTYLDEVDYTISYAVFLGPFLLDDIIVLPFIVPSCDLLQNFCKNIFVLENSAIFCLIFVLFFKFIFFELMFCIM